MTWEPSFEVSLDVDLILGENLLERNDIIKIVIPIMIRTINETIRHFLSENLLPSF